MATVTRKYYITRNDGVRLYKTYSDQNKYIKQLPAEVIYDVAIDVETAPYYYIEVSKEEYEEYLKNNEQRR